MARYYGTEDLDSASSNCLQITNAAQRKRSMRLIYFIGWKSLLCATTFGVLIYLLLWLSIPYSPRFTIPLQSNQVAYSRDGHVAILQCNMIAKGEMKGEIGVWDTLEGRQLFSIPFLERKSGEAWPNPSMAFIPDQDQFVVFVWGRATYFSLPTGNRLEPAANPKFPSQADEIGLHSVIVLDSDWKPYVMVHDTKEQKGSIRKLNDGTEIANFPTEYGEMFAPGTVAVADMKNNLKIRDIPSGKVRFEFKTGSPTNHTGRITCTPDGRTFIHSLNGVRVWTDGMEHVLTIETDGTIAITPDGTQFAALLEPRIGLLSRLFANFGRDPHVGNTAIHDIATGQEIARVAIPGEPSFSRDGQTLAIHADDALHFYDYPLQKPWAKILGLACVVSIVSYAAGRWICRKRHLSEPRT